MEDLDLFAAMMEADEQEQDKRGRNDDEEERNERVAKKVVTLEPVRNLMMEYVEMPSWRRRHLNWWQSLVSMHPILRQLVASSDVGVLMTLAQMHPLFADLARQDIVWQSCFERDFPREWKFCKGVLPFYVLEPSHPFWVPGDVPREDASPWKRFYLRVARQYVVMTRDFVTTFAYLLRYSGTPSVSLELDDAKTIRRWFQKVYLDTHFYWHDYDAQLCWYWVRLFASFLYPATQWQSSLHVAVEYCLFALEDDTKQIVAQYRWLLPYLSHSNPYTEDVHYSEKTVRGDIRRAPDLGPMPKVLLDALQTHRTNVPHPTDTLYYGDTATTMWQMADDVWVDWLDHNPPWTARSKSQLFSARHRSELVTLLRALRGSRAFRDTYGMDDDAFDGRSQILIRWWDALAQCHETPCILNADMEIMAALIMMHTDSLNIRQRVTELIAQLPADMILDLQWNRVELRPVFPLATLERDFQAVCFPSIFVGMWGINPASWYIAMRQAFRLHRAAPRNQRGVILYTQAPICATCGRAPDTLQQCGGCCSASSDPVFYCDRACQRAHWHAEHGRVCASQLNLGRK